MKQKYWMIVLFISFTCVYIYGEDAPLKKGIFQNFSGGVDLSFCVGFTKSSNLDYIDIYYPYASFVFVSFKFDYLFLKRVNKKYKIGFGLAFGDSFNVFASDFYTIYGAVFNYSNIGILFSGSTLFYIFTFIYQGAYINRVYQKITFSNLIGSEDKNKFTLIEWGLKLELITYLFKYSDTSSYMRSPVFIITPYFFVGILTTYSSLHFERIFNKYIDLTLIIGGFFEAGFDVCNSTGGQSFFLSFGAEYRIGHTVINNY